MFRKLNMLCNRLKVSIGSLSICTLRIRLWLYRSAGMIIGNKTIIRAGFYIDRPCNIFVGDNSFINRFVHIFNGGGDAKVTIGNNVL